MKNDIYQLVTDAIIAGLEQAQLAINNGHDFNMPWVRVSASDVPRNIEGTPYRGVNFVILSMLSGLYPSQVFGTYKAWGKSGRQVRKGSKGIKVVFWSTWDVRDPASGETKKVPFARDYTVFAGEQVEGFDVAAHLRAKAASLPSVAVRQDNAELAARNFMVREGVTFTEQLSNRAFYSPSTDQIVLPALAQFKSSESYYATWLHELGHATGHAKRLNREFGKRFGDQAYAFEELVAEFAAAMMCARLGINSTTRADHAHYIATWLKVLRDDKRAAVSAAAQAQKAADMILGAMTAVEADTDQAEAA